MYPPPHMTPMLHTRSIYAMHTHPPPVCIKIVVSGEKASPPSKSQINTKKSLMNLIVIFYCPKSLKISYDNGLVSVRIFYKNNLIFSLCALLSTYATYLI